jgi:hypothetical protein
VGIAKTPHKPQSSRQNCAKYNHIANKGNAKTRDAKKCLSWSNTMGLKSYKRGAIVERIFGCALGNSGLETPVLANFGLE